MGRHSRFKTCRLAGHEGSTPSLGTMKTLLFSITKKDLEIQTFRAGGKGGQNQNKRDSGVRVIHKASGARGESREHRGQLENKRAAFRRMTETKEFKT